MAVVTYCLVALVVGIFAAVNLVWTVGGVGLLAVPFIASAAALLAACVFSSRQRVALR